MLLIADNGEAYHPENVEKCEVLGPKNAYKGAFY